MTNAAQSDAPTPKPVTMQDIMAAAMKLISEDPRFKVGEAEIRGNTYRVLENAPANLAGLFEYAATTHGESEFLIYEEERLTYAGLWRAARRFAKGLADTLDVKQGDRVALAMRNYPEWCVAYMGVISLGAVVVPLNAWWKTEELRYGLKDCGAKIVILDRRRLEYLSSEKDDLGLTFILAREADKSGDNALADYLFDDLSGGLTSDDAPPAADVAIGPDDDYAIYYTSGSTGDPKGVLLTHRGAVTTVMSWAFVAEALRIARGGVSLYGDNPGILLAIPLFHVTGSHSIFMFSYLVGRRVAMMYRWDARDAVDMINRHELTNFVGVPTQSFEMIEAAGDTPIPTLIDIGSGGAKRPPEHVRRLKEKFSHANPSSGYGLTETNAAGCVISLDEYQRKPDSTGRAIPPCTDIKVVGDNGDCGPGEVGEIWIRSPGNFRGYLNKPEATAKALTPDGWFKTGDLGRLDDEGSLYIVDRLKELIIRAGENISCLEVEARAYEHRAVLEAVVFSVPDEKLGERVGLVYYPKEGEALDAETLRAFMLESLANFKAPDRIWVSPQPLPRLGTAKFDKLTVKRIAMQNNPAFAL